MVSFVRGGCGVVAVALAMGWMPASAQEAGIEELIEEVAEELPDDDIADLVDLLEEEAAHPIYMPTARRERLERLPFLTPRQIDALLRLRDSLGNALQWEDLASAPELDSLTLRRLRPFVRFRTVRRPVRRFHQLARYRFAASDLADSLRLPFRILFRGRFDEGAFSGGIVYEKDAGEPWGYRGFRPEYVSIHGMWRSPSMTVTVGDYDVRWGQGLVVWHGFAMSRSRDVMNFHRYLPPLRGHTSVNEQAFFRGAALRRWGSGGWEWTVLASHRRMDGAYDTLEGEPVLVRLIQSGYHRTPLEISRRANTPVTVMGAAVQHHGMRGTVGVHALTTAFATPFAPGVPPQSAYPRGRRWWHGGVAWRRSWGATFSYGEVAVQHPWGWGGVGGVMTHIMDVTTGLMIRAYAPSYYPIFGRPPAAASSYAPERGVYYAVRWQTPWAWEVSGYVDVARALFLRPRHARPLQTADWLIQLRRGGRAARIRFFLRRKRIPETVSHTGALPTSSLASLYTAQGDAAFSSNEGLQWHVRTECRWLSDSEPPPAFLSFFGFRWQMPHRTSLTWRLAWSTVSSHLTRIYAYEHDVRYAFTFYQFTRPTWRSYLLLRKRWKGWQAEFKGGYALLSGPEGTTARWDLTLQLQWTSP